MTEENKPPKFPSLHPRGIELVYDPTAKKVIQNYEKWQEDYKAWLQYELVNQDLIKNDLPNICYDCPLLRIWSHIMCTEKCNAFKKLKEILEAL